VQHRERCSEGPSTEDCDLLSVSVPYTVLKRSYQILSREMAESDKELIEELNAVGFKTDFGHDGTGFQMKYLRRGGGYYLNVGCFELIVDGRVKVVQYSDIDRIVEKGALLRDGNIVLADALILATGYRSQQELVRMIFGDDVADRVGPIWGFDEEGELRNMWKRTDQEGLWFTAGSLTQCRVFSKFLALQIKACEEGLLSKARPDTAVSLPVAERTLSSG